VGAQLRVYRSRIRSVQSTKKITKAMELIAASRVVKAQARMTAARPYTDELTRALAALGTDRSLTHPLLVGVEQPRRTGIVVITSDRGLAGGYSVNAIKTAGELADRLSAEGRQVVRYVIGRKGVAFYRFRSVEVADSWTGFSEQPNFADASKATETLVAALAATSAHEIPGTSGTGIDELYVIYTTFNSMVSQTPTTLLVAPVRVPGGDPVSAEPVVTDNTPPPAYEFEPEADALIAALLPRYVSARIYSALLESAASESAARRRAMKSASDNATELIQTYTRLANQARQAEITQEISEIVGGANALAAASATSE
jgi:F-type H+-transporting ATPase subunit gamma